MVAFDMRFLSLPKATIAPVAAVH